MTLYDGFFIRSKVESGWCGRYKYTNVSFSKWNGCNNELPKRNQFIKNLKSFICTERNFLKVSQGPFEGLLVGVFGYAIAFV